MDQTSPSIQLLAYDGVFTGCRVYTSLGLSHYSSELGGVNEIVVAVDDLVQDVPHVVANALFYLVKNRLKLGWGVAVDGIEYIRPSFARKYQKNALYFTRLFDLPSECASVKSENGCGALLSAFFISKPEFDFFAKHGAERFESLLENQSLDPYHLARMSIL